MIVIKVKTAKSPAVFVFFCLSLPIAHYFPHTSRDSHNATRRVKSLVLLQDCVQENNYDEVISQAAWKRAGGSNGGRQMPVEF